MTKPKPTTIDEYIATLPEDRAVIIQKIRETVQRALPEAKETMSYGMPTFDLNGHHLVYFGAWKDHIGLYPLYTDSRHKELFSDYNKVDNSIRIPYDDPKVYEVVEKFALFRKEEEA